MLRIICSFHKRAGSWSDVLMIFLFSSFSRAGGCVKGVLVFMADWNVLAQSVHVCPSPLLWEENHEGETMDERKV